MAIKINSKELQMSDPGESETVGEAPDGSSAPQFSI